MDFVVIDYNRTRIMKYNEDLSMRPKLGRHKFGSCFNDFTYFRVGLMTLLFCCVASSPLHAVNYYSGGMATQLVRSSDEVIIELDGVRDPAEVAIDLAGAGFASLEKIEGIPSRYRYKRLSVDAGDAEALATIRGIGGIRAVRHTYQVPGIDVSLIHTGKVVVKFEQGTPSWKVDSIAAEHGAVVDRPILGLPQVYVLRMLDESVKDAVETAATLYGHDQTVYCHPSFFMKDLMGYHQVEIEDPLYPFQWHLNNTGQLDRGLIDADIDAPEAWEITQGSGAVIGVIDSAMHWEHEDLVQNYLTGFDYFDQDSDPTPGIAVAIEGHGTAVTGIICASGNDVGVRGVAPEAQWIGCRFSAFFVPDDQQAEAFLFCERSGAMAVNNSWGPVTGWLPTIPPGSIFLPDIVSDAITEIATNGRSGKGVLVLFSSGNGAIRLSFDNMYAALPHVMAIGATLRNDLLTCYSSYGPEQSVVAPGGGVDSTRSRFGMEGEGPCFIADIATTDIDESMGLIDQTIFIGDTIFGLNPATTFVGGFEVPDPEVIDFPDTAYTYHMNGTSSSCPVTTGVAALVYSINNNLFAREVRNIIEHTADKIDVPNEHFDAVTGHNDRYGHGRVNAHSAVLAAQAAESWPSPIENIQSISSQDVVIMSWDNPDWNVDGIEDEDVAGVLVVRGFLGQLDWAPVDGVEYTVGQQVAPGVIVVANDLVDSLTQTGLTEGEYEYALFVRNASNYYSWGRRTNIATTDTVSIPLASIQASPKAGSVPLAVHFAGGGIDDTELVSFVWTFGDGTTGTGAAVDHTYTTSGEYTARLTVTNASGQSATASVRIMVSSSGNVAPSVRISPNPSSGNAPLVVLFEGIADDPDGDNNALSYKWNFGDGTTSLGQVVEHVYLWPGTYGVTLEVTDQFGGVGMSSALIIVGGSGVTAAQTDPSQISNPINCGLGVPGAMVMSLVCLSAMLFIRRRR